MTPLLVQRVIEVLTGSNDPSDWGESVSPALKASLLRGLEQAENGETISLEELQERTQRIVSGD